MSEGGDVLAADRNKAGLKTSVSTFCFLLKHQLLLKPHDEDDDDDDDNWNTWSLQRLSPACPLVTIYFSSDCNTTRTARGPRCSMELNT